MPVLYLKIAQSAATANSNENNRGNLRHQRCDQHRVYGEEGEKGQPKVQAVEARHDVAASLAGSAVAAAATSLATVASPLLAGGVSVNRSSCRVIRSCSISLDRPIR